MSDASRRGRRGELAEALVLAAVFASSFTSLLDWPGWTTEIQPTEIIFILLLPTAIAAYGRRLWPAPRWSLALGAYVIANLLAGFAAAAWPPIVESLGRGYLVALSGIVACYVKEQGVRGVRRVALAWISGGVLLAAVSLAGYAYALAGIDNSTVKVFTNYPYFGTVMRAAGFTVTPGMLVIVLGFPLLAAWTIEGGGRLRWAALVPIALAMALSLSKEVVLFAMGAALLHPAAARAGVRWKATAVALTATVFWAGSHVVLLFNTPIQDSYLAGTPYTSGRVLANVGSVQVVETSYVALKRANWALGLAHPLLGVGPGHSNVYLGRMKAEGLYPEGLPEYDPHSTWVGAFSETGLLGLGTLAVMVASWGFFLSRRRLLSSSEAVLRSASMYLLILLVESVLVDAMNFRQLWIAIGLIMGTDREGVAAHRTPARNEV